MVTRTVWSLAVLLFWTASALSGDHQWVAGDALEPGHVYILQARTAIHPPWQPSGTTNPTHGPFWVRGGPIRVHERVEHDGRPWYRVTWIKPQTIGDQDDQPGWVDSADLMAAGVYFSH